jgi:hypothetical protein
MKTPSICILAAAVACLGNNALGSRTLAAGKVLPMSEDECKKLGGITETARTSTYAKLCASEKVCVLIDQSTKKQEICIAL